MINRFQMLYILYFCVVILGSCYNIILLRNRMSTKVYLRTSDSKAVTINIKDIFNYQKALQTINNKFKIAKQDIRLIYNGQNQTGDFKLNPELPHHIVHVINKKQAKSGPFKINITVNDGKNSSSSKEIQTDSKTTIKELINKALNQTDNKQGQQNRSVLNPKAFFSGKPLGADTTIEDHQISPDGNVVIMLQDPLDQDQTQLVTAALDAFVPTCIYLVQQKSPTYQAIYSAIIALKESGFIKNWQQDYEQARQALLPSPWGPYVWSPPPAGGDD